MEQDLLTVKQAAKLAGLTADMLYKILRGERHPDKPLRFNRIGSMVVIRRADLMNWLAVHRN